MITLGACSLFLASFSKSSSFAVFLGFDPDSFITCKVYLSDKRGTRELQSTCRAADSDRPWRQAFTNAYTGLSTLVMF